MINLYTPRKQNFIVGTIDPGSLEFTLGGEERATESPADLMRDDCRERQSQQRVKPKCEGYQ